MIELESKKNVERNVFRKTEEERLTNMKNDVSWKQLKIDELAKDLVSRLTKKQQELQLIEEECLNKAKDEYEDKERLEG